MRVPAPSAPAPALTGRAATTLALMTVALALLLYLPTLGLSWAYDDVDYLNQSADALAGRQGFLHILLRPQGEHIVAGFRLALFASLKLFGIWTLPFRAAVLLAHAASAFFLGLVARRYAAPSGETWAGLAAAALYVGACGFSSMWVWFPSGSSVPFAMALLTGGTAALAWRGRLGVRRARLLAGAAVAAALLTESTLAPMAALPLLVDEWERRHAGARRPVGGFTVFAAAAAALVAALASILYTRTFGPRLSISVRHGLPRAAFLLLVAPFRLFFPGIPIAASEPGLKTAVLGSVLGIAVASGAGALLLALWRRGAPRLAGVALLAAVGPVGTVALVGLGRWRNTYWEMLDADRYFFTLLVPLALLAGAVAASAAGRLRAWPRQARAALLLCVALGGAAELALHRRAMLGRIPFDIYRAHGRRFAQLGRLARRLEAAARALPPGAPPLTVPDTALWFQDVHNGQVTTRTLLYAIAGGPGPRLRLGGPQVGESDARLLNPVLAAWARETGERLPYLSIVAGRLVDAHVIRRADFSAGPAGAAVVSGFYAWEGKSRWMSGRGELRLTLTAPSLTFLVAVPGEALAAGPLHVAVSAVDETYGWSARLGTLTVARGGLQLLRLDATPFLSRLGAGRVVHLFLESDRTWKPAGTLSSSQDTRDLSIEVFAAGGEETDG